jgi:mono/diheme cytochrome c family protein
MSPRDPLRTRSVLAACLLLAIAACGRLPGQPGAPTSEDAFAATWSSQCAGCHGADGRWGPARNLDDPLYWAIASDEAVRASVRSGVPGTAMPGFGQAAGGALTEPQLIALVGAMRKRWARPQSWGGVSLPAYRGGSGSPQRGERVYGVFCAECHGRDGSGGQRGGSVVDRAFLRLVSRQALRLAVICGRDDLGMPDWRGLADRAMTDREIDDVVAWLTSLRGEDDAPARSAGTQQARR